MTDPKAPTCIPQDCPLCGSAAVCPSTGAKMDPHYLPGRPQRCAGSGLTIRTAISIWMPDMLTFFDEVPHD